MFYNGRFVDIDEYHQLTDSVYEVLRVKDGKPQFLADHLERFANSWKLSGRSATRSFLSDNELFDVIKEIIALNHIDNQNIRIDKDHRNILVQAVESFYPSSRMYEEGVYVRTMEYIRRNPNAKVLNMDLLERVKQMKKTEDVFEVLLVDSEGKISEGSKSNVFFIKGRELYTADVNSVLEGVTRKVLLEACKNIPDLMIKIESVSLEEVHTFDACFLTGTSIDLLPVKRINSQVYESGRNEVYKRLCDEFKKRSESRDLEEDTKTKRGKERKFFIRR